MLYWLTHAEMRKQREMPPTAKVRGTDRVVATAETGGHLLWKFGFFLSCGSLMPFPSSCALVMGSGLEDAERYYL